MNEANQHATSTCKVNSVGQCSVGPRHSYQIIWVLCLEVVDVQANVFLAKDLPHKFVDLGDDLPVGLGQNALQMAELGSMVGSGLVDSPLGGPKDCTALVSFGFC